jgi:hypothetical protein
MELYSLGHPLLLQKNVMAAMELLLDISAIVHVN